MELRDYVKIIGRHFWVFLVIVILTTGFALIFTKTRSTTYTALTTFTVNRASTLKQSQLNYYLYDNYYNEQSATLFAQTAQTWFKSPAFVTAVYQTAGLPLPNISQKSLGKTFKVAGDTTAVFNISLTGANKDETAKLMAAADNVARAKIKEQGSSDDTTFYQLNKFDAILSQDMSNLTLNVAIGLFSGLILGILVALAIAYFKAEK